MERSGKMKEMNGAAAKNTSFQKQIFQLESLLFCILTIWQENILPIKYISKKVFNLLEENQKLIQAITVTLNTISQSTTIDNLDFLFHIVQKAGNSFKDIANTIRNEYQGFPAKEHIEHTLIEIQTEATILSCIMCSWAQNIQAAIEELRKHKQKMELQK